MTKLTKCYYRRYTNLPILIDMLANKRLTIVGYESWHDANDRYAMRLFQKSDPSIEFLGAYCIAMSASQTFHQWKVFSDGPSGVCIKFDRKLFEKFAHKLSSNGYVCKRVEYVGYKKSQEEQDKRLQSSPR